MEEYEKTYKGTKIYPMPSYNERINAKGLNLHI